jgi:hypothetical protein
MAMLDGARYVTPYRQCPAAGLPYVSAPFDLQRNQTMLKVTKRCPRCHRTLQLCRSSFQGQLDRHKPQGFCYRHRRNQACQQKANTNG